MLNSGSGLPVPLPVRRVGGEELPEAGQVQGQSGPHEEELHHREVGPRDRVLLLHLNVRLHIAQGLLLSAAFSGRKRVSVHTREVSLPVAHDRSHEDLLLGRNGQTPGSLFHARLHPF